MSTVEDSLVVGLESALAELGISGVKVVVEVPTDTKNGDFTSNVVLIAFAKSKELGIKNYGSPFELATKIVEILNSKFIPQNSAFSKVEKAQPGFINFFLSKKALLERLNSILESGEDSLEKTMDGKRVIVEFTDPNPFKEFHIGHVYSNTVGESLARLFQYQGAVVRRVCYQGDVGLHVAKVLYGMMAILPVIPVSEPESTKGDPDFHQDDTIADKINELEEKSLKERIAFMGQAYVLGSKLYEEDESAKKEIHELNAQVYKITQGSQDNPGVKELYEKGKGWSLDYFETIYARLGTKFEGYYFESKVGTGGVQIVSEHIKDGIFQSSEGAVIFPGKKYGLHDRVFINSLGLPTYEAKELALAPAKYRDWKYDFSVIVTGNEITEYFKVLLKALSLISPDLAQKTRHVGHGMVRLPSGKMSSRTGNVVTGEALLDEVKKHILEQFSDMTEETAEKVAVGAVKYSFLRTGVGSDIELDIDESVNFDGNSGPYLQYAYVRTRSVLAKANVSSDLLKIDVVRMTFDIENEEEAVLRQLFRFSSVAQSASIRLNPSILCSYLFDLAHKYNLFYARHSILGSAKENFRLALSLGVSQVLERGLWLLGMPVLEKM